MQQPDMLALDDQLRQQMFAIHIWQGACSDSVGSRAAHVLPHTAHQMHPAMDEMATGDWTYTQPGSA